jgi:nitrate/nitrite-specific signal transduction histidine kinase
MKPRLTSPVGTVRDQKSENNKPRRSPLSFITKGGPTKLRARLTITVLLVALPLIAGLSLFLVIQARQALIDNAAARLEQSASGLERVVQVWLDGQARHIAFLASDLAALAQHQNLNQNNLQPTLQNFLAANPNFYLISIADSNGLELARSDGQALRLINDQPWFPLLQQARTGVDTRSTPLLIRPIIGPDLWTPALIIAAPLVTNSETGQSSGFVVGYATLQEIAKEFQQSRLGENGFALLVDETGSLLAHPDWAQAFLQTQYGLQDLSGYPPVAAFIFDGNLSVEKSTTFRFEGSDGQVWQSHSRRLDNGWGLIVQQQEQELLGGVSNFIQVAMIGIAAGIALLLGLVWYGLGRRLSPVGEMTDAARAISAGDFSQRVRVRLGMQQDELGDLAKAFNQMASQLQSLVGELEERVSQRTRLAQRRAMQLQVASQTAREAAGIRQVESLLEHVSNLITERFGEQRAQSLGLAGGIYHTGIFLTQEMNGVVWAMLRAASSEGGQRMLQRGHRLRVGRAELLVTIWRNLAAYDDSPFASSQSTSTSSEMVNLLEEPPEGIVGFAAAAGQARLALDVGSEAIFFNNPDLPETRSELALPLKVRQQVIGVLDVQSRQSGAFSDEDIEILQILADQVALAIDNARLLAESEERYDQLQRLYGQVAAQRWQERIRSARKLGKNRFTYKHGRIISAGDSTSTGVIDQTDEDASPDSIETNIELRGRRLGRLRLTRKQGWSEAELALVEQATQQAALALENARLLEEIQQRAFQEQWINQIISKAQAERNLENIIRAMTLELGQTIRAGRLQIRLETPKGDQVDTGFFDPQDSPRPPSNGGEHGS